MLCKCRMKISLFLRLIFAVEAFLILPLCYCSVTMLDSKNIDLVLGNNQLVFVNFYADWCRFSRMLAPVFEEASNLVARDYTQPGAVLFAKVDCDNQPAIAQKYHVNKYPTMKLFRAGQLVKREYRGQRSAESLANYIREQARDPIREFKSLDEIYELSRDKRTIIGYFTAKATQEYQTFEKVAKTLKDDCTFYAGFGEASQAERTTGDNIIYKPIGENTPEMVYLGSLTNHDLLMAWAQDKCVPLVREITFQNGEELTEEGLPFLILFYGKEDTESLEIYKKEVSRLVNFKTSINFLVADCATFSHPLHHLQKSVKDCPLVAIDSFKHMYLFPKFEDITIPGKLKQFILDLHSGKLHREFHHGPDAPETSAPPPPDSNKKPGFHAPGEKKPQNNQPKPGQPTAMISTIATGIKDAKAQVKTDLKTPKTGKVQTTPPESIFKKLKPSEHRYSLRDRDEL